jgi:hypothetical protein
MNKISKLSKSDINNIIKLYTVEGLTVKDIKQIYGVGHRKISRILKEAGITVKPFRKIDFPKETQELIFSAYESGVGVNGIPECLGLTCSYRPVRRLLEEKFGKLRNPSEQQFKRMENASPEEIAYLTKAAHDATRGRIVSPEELRKRAKSKEGKTDSQSSWEPLIFAKIKKAFPNAIPSKAIDIYNADIGIGKTIAVEIFGGGWAISDKARINRYLTRTKEFAKRGIHTIFIILSEHMWTGDTSELIRTINIASSFPTTVCQYWVIWGNRKGVSGNSLDINKDAFIRPFINVRDRRTGRYVSVPR